jgi:hypothetical protein
VSIIRLQAVSDSSRDMDAPLKVGNAIQKGKLPKFHFTDYGVAYTENPRLDGKISARISL